MFQKCAASSAASASLVELSLGSLELTKGHCLSGYRLCKLVLMDLGFLIILSRILNCSVSLLSLVDDA